MNGIEQRLPFEEYKDRQLQIPFDYEQEIAEVLEDDDGYDPMLLDYKFKNGQINKS